MILEEFYHLKSPPDGGCFFHSLATIFEIEKFNTIEKVRKTKEKPFQLMKESNALRKRVVDWLRKNMDYRIKGIGLRLEDELQESVDNEIEVAEENDRDPNYESIDEYLDFMSGNYAYAGQFEIYAIAELFGRNVRVFTEKPLKSGNLHNFGLGYELNNNKNDIYLFHNLSKQKNAGKHHFEPLILKSAITKDSGKPKPVKKSTRRATSRRATARRATTRRATARRATTRRATTRRATARRATARRATTRRATTRRATARRATRRNTRRATARRATRRNTRRATRRNTRRATRRATRRNTRKTQKRK